MKILAVDTTSGACSVALYDQGQVNEIFVRAERDHTRRLLPMVEQLLGESGYRLAQMDSMAVSQGPGSFTGLRIAISCVQGLAFSADLPVVPVSSLAALALGATRDKPEWSALQKPVLAALDARMNEVYWGLYDAAKPGHALLPDQVSSPEQVIAALQAAGYVATEVSGSECDEAPLLAAGPGWGYPELAALNPRALFMDAGIHAQDIAVLAADLWQQGQAVSADKLQPAYLRNEVTWKKRERIRPAK
uniref:tRNA (adenosine(37)-N6)-threonylcarbamoyltransferase complex dimerization subunit type 1 TsaB n=1 Tax=Microbulbifer agarilyticus TaxID=260552 RepID=UPI000C1F8BE3|nr:tRNA (adenosine(37)-N6)-threonylcarbamoyltransferase complex dimerization subunit type 1 TsaB [Microbulbifer agarilyticus]